MNAGTDQALALGLVRLEGAVHSMEKRQTAEGDSNRMILQQLQQDVRKMSERFESVPVMMERLASNATAVEALAVRMNDLSAHTDSRFGTQSTRIESASSMASRIVWLGTGAMAVMGVVMSLLVYMYNGDKQSSAEARRVLSERINDNQNITTGRHTAADSRLDRIELYLAGDHSERFKR
jgi:hypothetical protein